MADNYCKCCGDGTPEYIIELNQQGAPGKRGEKGEQGYSPVVDFIANNDEIRFTSTNEDNITSTPNLYDYLAKKDLSNVSNLYDLLLKRDGSNATDAFRLNKIRFITNNNTAQRMSSLDSTGLNLSGNPLRLDGEASGSLAYPNRIIISESGRDITLGNTNKANIIINNDMATYNGNELATVNNISDSTITIKQGNDIKGTFTLNQESDAVITLDSGIVNPLETYSDDKTKKFQIKYDSDNSLTINNYTLNSNGNIELGLELMPIYSVGNPLLATKETSSTYAKGLYTLTLQYDNDTLKLNGDNKLYADFTPINNSITTIEGNLTELTTLANNTEATLNELKTDYETNKTNVAEELTTLGNQLNEKANLSDLSNYVPLTTYNALLARVEALEAEINGGNA